MGAVFGYIGNTAFDRDSVFQKMSSPAEYWGKDGQFRYDGKEIVCGYLHRYNTPEAVHEKQPYQVKPGVVLFFNGRIDNRTELAGVLKEKDSPGIPDGKLASGIWEKYGEEIADHIEGDWVIVVWDSASRKLNIFRDHHGYSALYYYSDGKIFAFATCIKSLLALEEIEKKPDMKRVAQALTSWQGDGLRSAYSGIFRLPPAHNMVVDAQQKITIKRHWFPESIKPVHYKNEQDYYHNFFEEYSRAVKVRLRTYRPAGSQLSGGLDSGTVVALAAMHLKEKGIRLPAFTHVPAFGTSGLTSKNRFGDEGELAKMTADFTGNTDWHPVAAADVDPFEAIREGVEVHDEPFHAGANTFWITEIKKVASEMGLGTMLTGQGGNATVSWPTPGFLQKMSRKKDLIKPGDFFSYYGWRHVLLPLYLPEFLKNKLRKGKKGKLPFLDYSAMNKEYAVSQKIMEQMMEDDHDPTFSKNITPLQTRLKIIKPGSSIVGFLHSQSAAWNGLEMRDPTFDKRLMEFCLSVPDNIYVSGGKDRMLLRKSFDGKLPPEVLWNTRRGRQSADIGHRVVKFRQSGYDMLNRMEGSALCREMLDIKRMRTILDSLCVNVNSKNNTAAGTVLLRGITAGLFLMRFEK